MEPPANSLAPPREEYCSIIKVACDKSSLHEDFITVFYWMCWGEVLIYSYGHLPDCNLWCCWTALRYIERRYLYFVLPIYFNKKVVPDELISECTTHTVNNSRLRFPVSFSGLIITQQGFNNTSKAIVVLFYLTPNLIWWKVLLKFILKSSGSVWKQISLM